MKDYATFKEALEDIRKEYDAKMESVENLLYLAISAAEVMDIDSVVSSTVDVIKQMLIP